VEKGRRLLNQLKNPNPKEQILALIAIDAIFTPNKRNVRYSVEKTRVVAKD